MREMRGAGIVTVEHIPTEFNPADIFAKILPRQTFEKHRRTVLNLADDTHESSASRGGAAPGDRVAASRGGSAAHAG